MTIDVNLTDHDDAMIEVHDVDTHYVISIENAQIQLSHEAFERLVAVLAAYAEDESEAGA